jgi:hypothetical protein
VRYEAEGLEGLIDRRLEQVSNRRAAENTNLKFFPLLGATAVLFSTINIPPSARLLISITINALLGFALMVISGAEAGNSNNRQQFIKQLLPVEIGLAGSILLASVIFQVFGKHKMAVGLPFATIPVLNGRLLYRTYDSALTIHAMSIQLWGQSPNPSINTDWRDKAAPAGYVKRWAP